MASKFNTCKVADLLSLMAVGEGMKILCFKSQIQSSINDSCERTRAITNASFTLG